MKRMIALDGAQGEGGGQIPALGAEPVYDNLASHLPSPAFVPGGRNRGCCASI